MKEIVEALEFEYPTLNWLKEEVYTDYKYLLIIYKEPLKYTLKSLINRLLFRSDKIEYKYTVEVIYQYNEEGVNIYNGIFNKYFERDAFFRVPLLKKKGWDIVRELKSSNNK